MAHHPLYPPLEGGCRAQARRGGSAHAVRRAVQRGYSLVELAILLTVVALIAGATLLPMGAVEDEEVHRKQIRAMQAQQDAILGYAIANSTREIEVMVMGPDNSVTHRMPAGRPYLPCPDITGDGNEDRHASAADRLAYQRGDPIIMGVTVVPFGPNRLTVNLPGFGLSQAGGAGVWTGRANCLSTRGILPWKTLGVPPADHWGNRYTYQVDELFSDAAYGFNQDSIPDSSDPRGLLVDATSLQVQSVANAGTFVYPPRLAVTVQNTVGIPAADRPVFNRRAFLIMNEFDVRAVRAGKVSHRTELLSRRLYMQGDVLEGPVYAIVSHGKNGHGAVNHLSSSENRMICNAPVHSMTSSAGLGTANDTPYAIGASNREYLTEVLNFPFMTRLIYNRRHEFCRPVSINGLYPIPPVFLAAGVRRKDVSDDERYFDDLVVWSMRQDLFRHLILAKKLPAPPAPVFRPIH